MIKTYLPKTPLCYPTLFPANPRAAVGEGQVSDAPLGWEADRPVPVESSRSRAVLGWESSLFSRGEPMGFNPFMRSRRARSGPSNHSSQFEEDRSGTLETAAELAFQAFLQPYELNDLTITVQKLTASGYTSVEAVRGMDEKSATDLGLHDDDVEKVLLAAFLYGNELPQYGAGFVSIGCDTLLKAYVLSDEGLQQAGVRTIGHRRQLQRYLREDDRVITKLRRREEEKAAAAADAEKRLGGGMVGSAAQTPLGPKVNEVTDDGYN